MVDFISQIQADKIKIVEKLSVQHLVKDIYKVTDEEIYRKLNHAYKQVTEYARYSLGEQFDKIIFYNHEKEIIEATSESRNAEKYVVHIHE